MHISGFQPRIFPAQEKPYSRATKSEVLEESFLGADPCLEVHNVCLFVSDEPNRDDGRFASNGCQQEKLAFQTNT